MAESSGQGGAFLLGALLGAGAALLLAPAAGRETRARVKRWIDEWEENSGCCGCAPDEVESEAGEGRTAQ